MTSALSGFKQAALRTYDAQLLSTAVNFDLQQKVERRRSTLELERLFFQGLNRSRTQLFIEAGANDGRTSIRAQKYMKAGKVVAFEANPFVFEQYAGAFRTKFDGIDYRNFALCERQGAVMLNVRKTEEGKPLADKQATLIKRTDYEPGYVEVTVPATTLDDVVVEFKAESCTMWIDVEGSQKSVLTGGRNALKRAAMVFIEVEDKESWPSQWVKSDVDSFLFDAGLVPVARDFQGRFQHNVLFWREALLREGYFRRILAEYFSRIGKGRHSHIEAYQDDINSSAS